MIKTMALYHKGMAYVHSLLRRQPKSASLRFCCLTIQAQEILIVCGETLAGKRVLQTCATEPFQIDLSQTLAHIVVKYHLEGAECILVLQPDDYQLLPLPTLPVTPDEFQEAVRWKIKDLLNFPVTDAVVDSFPMPLPKVSNARQTVMVVAARASFLQEMSQQINAAGLLLTDIAILELGLRNVTAFYENDEKTTALIYLQKKSSQLIITRQKLFYLARRLDFGLESLGSLSQSAEEENPRLGRLALEIQRSFDYFHSQWRLPIPVRVFLASEEQVSTSMCDFLSQQLNIGIEQLTLAASITGAANLNVDTQGKYLPLIGHLYPPESVSYATKN